MVRGRSPEEEQEVITLFNPGAAAQTEETSEADNCCCCCISRQSYLCQKRPSRNRESDRGVLVIVLGLGLFSLVYYFSRTHTYDIEPVKNFTYTYRCNRETSTCELSDLLPPEHPQHNSSSEPLIQGINTCSMACAPTGGLWPLPSGPLSLSGKAFAFLPGDVAYNAAERLTTNLRHDFEEIKALFKQALLQIHPEYDPRSRENPFPGYKSGQRVMLYISLSSKNNYFRSDEAYELHAFQDLTLLATGRLLRIDIRARTLTGAQHGLRTLLQLITFDEMTSTLQMDSRALVRDSPSVSWRGLALEGSGVSALGLPALKQLVEGMAAAKMNRLRMKMGLREGRLNYESYQAPELCRDAVSSGLIYHGRQTLTQREIKTLSHFAKIRGVTLVPDLEVPFVDEDGTCLYREEGYGDRGYLKEAIVLKEVYQMFKSTFIQVSKRNTPDCSRLDSSILSLFRRPNETTLLFPVAAEEKPNPPHDRGRVWTVQNESMLPELIKAGKTVLLSVSFKDDWSQMYNLEPRAGLPSKDSDLLLGMELVLNTDAALVGSLTEPLWPGLAAAAEALWTGKKPRLEEDSVSAQTRLSIFRHRLSHRTRIPLGNIFLF